MKILHLCLASFYIDNYSYQENILPKYHKINGYNVEIIASLISFDKNGKITILDKACDYTNENGINVKRLNYRKSIFSKRLRQYVDFYKALLKASPDIIFIHGLQFLDIKFVVKYVNVNPKVKIYVDNHADFSNSARTFISKNILHKLIWKSCAKKIEPYTTMFFGVLPARVDFLIDVYKIPKEKVRLLVMGADDDKVHEALKEENKNIIRKKYGIQQTDFLIITGGKIDQAKKQTLLLMEAVKELQRNDIKLIIFGSVVDELKNQVDALADGSKIQYIGWIDAIESYLYFAAADLVIFPGRHSVFWEQVVALKKPLIVKYWKGTTHIDISGNCKFLYEDSVEEIKKILLECINPINYKIMKESASSIASQKFLYSNIAIRSIE